LFSFIQKGLVLPTSNCYTQIESHLSKPNQPQKKLFSGKLYFQKMSRFG